MNYVVGVSKSRAKRKRRQRAPAERAVAPGATASAAKAGRAQASGAKASGAKASGAKASGAKASGAKAGGAKASGAKASGAKAGGAKASGAKAGGAVRRPEPIWAPFPLTEVGMGVGIVIFGVGYATTNTWLLSVGAIMLAVVVGELCVREHFAGFRSHALLLAALTVVSAHSLVFAIDDAYRGPVALAVDLAIGGGLAWWLRGRFRIAREGHAAR